MRQICLKLVMYMWQRTLHLSTYMALEIVKLVITSEWALEKYGCTQDEEILVESHRITPLLPARDWGVSSWLFVDHRRFQDAIHLKCSHPQASLLRANDPKNSWAVCEASCSQVSGTEWGCWGKVAKTQERVEPAPAWPVSASDNFVTGTACIELLSSIRIIPCTRESWSSKEKPTLCYWKFLLSLACTHAALVFFWMCCTYLR